MTPRQSSRKRAHTGALPTEWRPLLHHFKPSVPEGILVGVCLGSFLAPSIPPGSSSFRFVCGDCGSRYPSAHLLQSHRAHLHTRQMSISIGDVDKKCRRDDRPVDSGVQGSENGSDLAVSATGRAKCPHCAATLTYSYNLSKHIDKRHNTPTGLFHCRLCAFRAKTVSELDGHRKSRHRKCPFCQIRFGSERGMNRHMFDCPERKGR